MIKTIYVLMFMFQVSDKLSSQITNSFSKELKRKHEINSNMLQRFKKFFQELTLETKGVCYIQLTELVLDLFFFIIETFVLF